MKSALIAALWGLNVWYVTNFAAAASDGPSLGPVAGLAGALIAWLVLTRRSQARVSIATRATA